MANLLASTGFRNEYIFNRNYQLLNKFLSKRTTQKVRENIKLLLQSVITFKVHFQMQGLICRLDIGSSWDPNLYPQFQALLESLLWVFSVGLLNECRWEDASPPLARAFKPVFIHWKGKLTQLLWPRNVQEHNVLQTGLQSPFNGVSVDKTAS